MSAEVLFGQVSSWVPVLVHAEAGDNGGGVVVEEQLEVVRRFVELDCADAYQVVTGGTQIVDGLGEADCRDAKIRCTVFGTTARRWPDSR